MATNKPSNTEDEYFAKQEAARLKAAAIEKARQLEAAEIEARKQAHWMKCPKCGYDLHTVPFRGVSVERCFHCNGTFLDPGELEALAGKEHGFLGSIVGFFQPDKEDK